MNTGASWCNGSTGDFGSSRYGSIPYDAECIKEYIMCDDELYVDRLHKIADKHGLDAQIRKSIEELSELIRALARYDGSDCDNLIDELADSIIMIEQIIYLTYTDIDVSEKRKEKIDRQIERDGLK